jgi:hypothetical protein
MKKIAMMLALAGSIAALNAQDPAPLARPPQRIPFVVYEDGGSGKNHYTASGYMGDYSDLALNQNHKENPGEGTTCIRVRYNAKVSQGQRWAGVYWQDPPNNFGTVKNGGYNVAGAKKLKFMARGEKGGEVLEFACGGIPGEFPDTFLAASSPEVLSSDWKEYEIDLEGFDLSICQGGFRFVIQQEKHPEGAVFYLDNIRYE